MRHLHRFAVAVTVGLALSCRAVSADTRVSTVAGSGFTGFADGASQSASFMLPLGVAFDAGGQLYVADAAAQRIRVVARDGTVRTLAGGGTADASGVWVPGGYADGAGSAAQFNHPAAVAIGPDGRAYVADSYNHCIRVVSPQGEVSTFAGAPTRPGYHTGPRAVAELVMPMGLAFDRKGNLYVADAALANAVRKIDPSGVMSAVDLPGHVQPPGGIAVVDGADGLTLVLADLTGLYVRHADQSVSFFRSERFRLLCAAHTAPSYAACDQPETILRGHGDVGLPMGLVAFDDHEVAYTDFRTNAVRLIDIRSATVRLLAGNARGDGSGRGGGTRDGEGRTASFNMPFGISAGSQGDLVVADGGSRRVRIIRNVDRGEVAFSADLSRLGAPNGQRIAYAGDNSIWQGTEFSDSIEGRLQRRLKESGCPRCGTLNVVPVVLGPSIRRGLADLESARGPHFAAVVLQLNVLDAASLADLDVRQATSSPNLWRAGVTTALRQLAASMRRQGSRLLVVVQPLPSEIGPGLESWGRLSDIALDRNGASAALEASAAAAGVPVTNATSDFLVAERSAVPPALFATDAPELAAGGRQALAAAAFRALVKMGL